MRNDSDTGLLFEYSGTGRLPTLALGMVVRDGVEDIKAILTAVGNLFDEVILVLHRSQPATVRAINQIGSRYHMTCLETDIPSQDQAKNLFLSNCSSDWLLTLDSDERIASSSVTAIRAGLRHVEDDIGALLIANLNYFGRGRWITWFQPRVIRPHIARYNRWLYHASVVESISQSGKRMIPLSMRDIRIEHLGGLRASEYSKRVQRIQALEAQLASEQGEPFILAALGLEYMALGKMRRAHECIELALNLQGETQEELLRVRRDMVGYLLAICSYRLNLTWLARPQLEQIADHIVYSRFAQCMLADLDYRAGDVLQAIQRLEGALDQHPDASDLLVNAAAVAAELEPEKAIHWALQALESTPSLRWPEIYAAGAIYNLYAVQDYFVTCYDNVYAILSRACMHKGNRAEAREWREQERSVVHSQGGPIMR